MNAMKYGVLALAAGVMVSCTPYRKQAEVVDSTARHAVGETIGPQERNYAYYGIPDPGDADAETDRSGSDAEMNQLKPSEYPEAQLTETEDEVLSPYPPFRRINVAGYKPGQLVMDPKSGERFRVP